VLRKSLVLAAIFSGVLATSLSAATIPLWSTGICSGLNTNLANCSAGAGSPLNYGVPDANYVFSGPGLNTTNVTVHAVAGSPGYVPDAAGSEWLEPGNTAGVLFPSGAYTVTSTFSLAGFDATTLTLFLDIAADNDVVAALNGTTILSCGTVTGTPSAGNACFSAFTSNHSINASSIALPGLNTLTYTVYNENNLSLTALRVQIQGNANLITSAVPEPGTLMLLSVGLAGLGLLRRKRA
jgi:hypothetical protein